MMSDTYLQSSSPTHEMDCNIPHNNKISLYSCNSHSTSSLNSSIGTLPSTSSLIIPKSQCCISSESDFKHYKLYNPRDYISLNSLWTFNSKRKQSSFEPNYLYEISKRKQYTSHFRGVYKKNDKYQAQIQVKGKKIYLGSFDTEWEAANSYDQAAYYFLGSKAKRNLSTPIHKQNIIEHLSKNSSKRKKIIYSQFRQTLSQILPSLPIKEYLNYKTQFKQVNFHNPLDPEHCTCFICINRSLSKIDPSILLLQNDIHMDLHKQLN